jgi:molybdate transport system substrate-binding protein
VVVTVIDRHEPPDWQYFLEIDAIQPGSGRVLEEFDMIRPRVAGLLGVLLVALTACSSAATPGPSAGSSGAPAGGSAPATANLTIYGAASLSGALAKVKTAYETANPGTTLTISTDSSAALETQIEQGAPADVFLSADTTNPKKLVDGGLAAGAAVKFAGNKLTIIVPTANPAGIKTAADLAKAGVKVIAAGDAVPITKYASQLVANLAKVTGYPANFVAAYTANIASKEDNVKAVVAKIELGEGDAGIVYVTDAKASTKVTTVDVPDAANVPATYAGVVVKASANATAAQAFLTWFAGPDGQAILVTFGFLPPS